MDNAEILTRLGLALAIGFLVGVERGWRERDAAEGARVAGLRTFALIGLAGGLFALVAQSVGEGILAAGFAAVALVVTLFRWRELKEQDASVGATTVIAAFITFALGAYAVLGSMVVAAAAGVATAAILAAKSWLHSWLKTLTWGELRAALTLAAMTFVALPVLPDRGLGPYEALNPRDLWLMTIAIAGVSFIGYIAVRIAGARYGPLVAGIAGGVVSSTITTVDLARRARKAPAGARLQIAGAFAASATMFARVGIIVAVFGPELLGFVAGPLAAAFIVSVGAAVALDQPWRGSKALKDAAGPPLRNPFDLLTVLGFGAMLAVVVLLSAVLTRAFGGGGGVLFAAVAGLSDVDAITLSMTEVAGSALSTATAALAILVAVSADSMSKSVLATLAGGPRFGLIYSAVSLTSLAAGGIVALLQMWSF